MRICSNFIKELQENSYRWKAYSVVYLHSTCSQFHTYFIYAACRARVKNVPGVRTNYQFCWYYVRNLSPGVIELMPPDGKALAQFST